MLHKLFFSESNIELRNKIPAASVRAALVLLKQFLSGRLGKEEFIQEMEKEEGGCWYFTLDDNRLLLRNYFEKVVVKFDRTMPDSLSYVITGTELTLSEEMLGKIRGYKAVINEKTKNKKILAFSGVARKSLELQSLKEFLRVEIGAYSPDEYAILTGGYYKGIPHLVATIAKEKGFQTIAVTPQINTLIADATNALHLYDLEIVEGEDWGDESYVFAGVADKVILSNGGFWTAIELYFANTLSKETIFLVL